MPTKLLNNSKITKDLLPDDFKFDTFSIETLYYTYIGARLCKGLDIVILLDLTGSMSPFIQMAKNTITKIVEFSKEKYVLSTVRFAFVGYRDFSDGDKRLVKLDFSSDTKPLISLLGN